MSDIVILKCSVSIKPAETMKLIITTFVGVVFGFFLGICFPTMSLTKVPELYDLVTFINFSMPFNIVVIPVMWFPWYSTCSSRTCNYCV